MSNAPRRAPQEINAEYTSLCAQLGDVIYQQRALRFRRKDILTALSGLEYEMELARKQPAAPAADKGPITAKQFADAFVDHVARYEPEGDE